MTCLKCEYLSELFKEVPQTNRNYWLMTELFVMLHDGTDHCEQPEIKLNTKELEFAMQQLVFTIHAYLKQEVKKR